jgi:periplasmic protein TonB
MSSSRSFLVLGDQPRQRRIRVGGSVQATNLIKKVAPAYPRDAKSANVQGEVRFRAVIDKHGKIADLDTISGPGALIDAARDAVKQWVYKPTLLNGQPIEVITEIDVNFTLSQ